MDRLENELGRIRRWQFVTDKRGALKTLRDVIGKSERVVHVIDGFYSGGVNMAGSDSQSGLIVITGSRCIIIKSGSSSDVFKLDEVKNLRYKKGYSSLELAIETSDRTYSFFTPAGESEVRAAFSGEFRMDELPAEVNREFQILETGSTSAGGSLVDELSSFNFLFREAKSISENLGELSGLCSGSDFKKRFARDMESINSLFGREGKTPSEHERIFKSMILIGLNSGENAATSEFAEKLFYFDSFPLHLKEEVLKFSAADEMLRSEDSSSFVSLDFLQACDRKGGTKYRDRGSSLLYKYGQCLTKADGTVDRADLDNLKILSAKLHEEGAIPDENIAGEREETLDEVMEQVNSLVGMKNIKDEIASFVNFVRIRKERELRGLPVTPLSLHSVFYGPPGTGKTTIARLLGRIYRALGLLKGGQLIETDRAGLVAGYVGQTAIKVDEIVQKAMDGVLFIDEAYTLSPAMSGNDFGQEAVDAILKRMEDHRERFAVIVAGYPDEMKRFINSNPGLKSRFSRYFYFDHYDPDELLDIFEIFAGNVEFKLSEDASEKLGKLIAVFYDRRDRTFGNGRFVRNVFEKIVERQSNRLASVTPLTDELLCEITGEDIPEPDDFTGQ